MANFMEIYNKHPQLMRFVNSAEALCTKFDDHNGDTSCEFATSADDLDVKMELLAKMPCKSGYWVVSWCTTFENGHGSVSLFRCTLVSHMHNGTYTRSLPHIKYADRTNRS